MIIEKGVLTKIKDNDIATVCKQDVIFHEKIKDAFEQMEPHVSNITYNKISIGPKVVKIAKGAFDEVENNISQVELGENVSELEDEVFAGLTKLEKVNLRKVKIIGKMCFAESGLRAVTLPETVHSLSDRLFENCHQLDKVAIHGQIREVGQDVFKGCEKLGYVNYFGKKIPVEKFEDENIVQFLKQCEDEIAFSANIAKMDMNEMRIMGKLLKYYLNKFDKAIESGDFDREVIEQKLDKIGQRLAEVKQRIVTTREKVEDLAVLVHEGKLGIAFVREKLAKSEQNSEEAE